MPGEGYVVVSSAVSGVASDGRVFLSTSEAGIEKGDREVHELGAWLCCEPCAGDLFAERVWTEAKPQRIDVERDELSTPEGNAARQELIGFSVALQSQMKRVNCSLAKERSRKLARKATGLWSFDGRIPRSKFWGGLFVVFLVWVIFHRAQSLVDEDSLLGYLLFIAIWPVGVLLFIASLWFVCATFVRRLHDQDLPWAWIFLFGSTSVVGTIVLGSVRGTDGPNRFGPDPLTAGLDLERSNPASA